MLNRSGYFRASVWSVGRRSLGAPSPESYLEANATLEDRGRADMLSAWYAVSSTKQQISR